MYIRAEMYANSIRVTRVLEHTGLPCLANLHHIALGLRRCRPTSLPWRTACQRLILETAACCTRSPRPCVSTLAATSPRPRAATTCGWTWWSSLSDGEKKKVQKVTRRPPNVCSRYIQKCPKHNNKGNGTRFLMRLPDAAHSADTRRRIRNTPIKAMERRGS